MAGIGTKFQRLLNANLDVLAGRPGVPAVVLVVMAALVLVRAGLYPGTGGDDGEQLIFSQVFAWGYQVRNPPLYTWAVMGVSQVTGANLWAVNIVKFALLAAMYLFLWRACRHLFRTPEMAAVAALSPVLMYYVAWEVLTGFSHTVMTAALYAATFLMVVRLQRNPERTTTFLLLGAVIGLGAQAKYAYWIFLLSLVAAGLFDRALRRAFLSPRMLLALAVAAALAAPHYHWLWQHFAGLKSQGGAVAQGLNLKGLGHALNAGFGFLTPFWLIALACFPAVLNRKAPPIAPAHPMARVIGIHLALVLAGTLIGALLLPDFRLRTHYMFVLLLAPVWFLLLAEAAPRRPGRVAAFAGAVSLCLAAGPVGLAVKFVAEPLVCERCQHHVPYADLAAQIRAMGFRGGTVSAYWHPDPLPGNLRAVLPEARVISLKHPDVIPPERTPAGEAGQCLVVWSADARRDLKLTAIGETNRLFAAGIPPGAPHRLLVAPMPMGQGKTATLGVVLTDGRGKCR